MKGKGSTWDTEFLQIWGLSGGSGMIMASGQAIVVDLLLGAQIGLSLLLIVAVMLQRPRNEGLGTLSGGALESVVGADATGVLRGATAWMGVAFLINSLLLAVLM